MIRHTGTYSVAVVFARIAGLVMLPIYTRFLSPTDYGLLDLLEIVNQIFVLLLGINLSSAMAFFCARAETPEDRTRVTHTAILGAHLIGSVAVVGGWLLAPFLSRILFQTLQFTPHCRVTIISLALGLPQEMSLALLRLENRSSLYVRLVIARMLVGVAMNTVLLTVFHLGALAMLVGTMTASLIIVLYLDRRNLLGVPAVSATGPLFLSTGPQWARHDLPPQRRPLLPQALRLAVRCRRLWNCVPFWHSRRIHPAYLRNILERSGV
jgi:O-antigen/teichoic acid export membrane protein